MKTLPYPEDEFWVTLNVEDRKTGRFRIVPDVELSGRRDIS